MYWLRVSCSAGHMVESLHRHCIRNHMLWASSVGQPGCQRQLKQFLYWQTAERYMLMGRGLLQPHYLHVHGGLNCSLVPHVLVPTNRCNQHHCWLVWLIAASGWVMLAFCTTVGWHACMPASYLLNPSLVCTHDQKQLDAVHYNTISHPVNARKNSQAMPQQALAMQDVQPTEDFILVIDADMIMRQPFNPVTLGAGPGWAISAFFTYLKGVSNELAMRHVPNVKPREDNLAGPPGRRGDQVGGFTLMNTKDLARVAPMWLFFTTAVRNDPTVWVCLAVCFRCMPYGFGMSPKGHL